MAKKNFFAVIFLMIAAMINLSACSESGIADIDGDLTVDINGGEDKPDPDPDYKVVCDHVEFITSPGVATFKDVHEAHLMDGENIIESKQYNVYDEVRHNRIVLKRAIAEELLGQHFDNEDGCYLLYENVKLYVSVETTGCDTVVLGGKTYCHPKYGVKGATAALTSCTFEDQKVFFTALSEESLEGEVTLISDEGKEVIGYLELPVTDDDVIGAEFDDFRVTGSGTATINEYETLNGNRTGKVTPLNGKFTFEFSAGPEIVKISANQPSLVSNVLQVTENETSFSYTLDGVSFDDDWTTKVPTEVEFVTTDGSKISQPLTDWTLTSLSFRQTSDNVWANNAQLSVNGVPQADDTQIIRVEDLVGWETDDYAVVTGRNEVTIKAYETRNGVRTGRVETLTASYAANLTAGQTITKTSQDILRLVNATATLSGSTASFDYDLGSESFEDKWNWSASSNATFTLPDGKTQVTKPIKADYSVKSTGLNINGNVYSNAASLYADNIAVAEDVQLITVNVPDYPGYKPYNTEQWAVTRIYDTNALQSLVIWVFTLQNVETGAIVGGYKVLDGNGNTAALPTQLQNLAAPSFTSPYSMYFNTKTSAWEYGSLGHANQGTRNKAWEYLKWNSSVNQPMSVNISQDVADDIAWLEDNKVVNGNIITITYNDVDYTITTEHK